MSRPRAETMPAVTRRAEAERVADRDHPVADPDLVAVGPGRRRERLRALDLEQRQIGLGVGADQLGRILALVAEDDGDLVGVGDDVVVGDDEAGRVDRRSPSPSEKLRRGCCSCCCWSRSKNSLKNSSNGEPGGNCGACGASGAACVAHVLAGRDVDHGRRDPADQVAETRPTGRACCAGTGAVRCDRQHAEQQRQQPHRRSHRRPPFAARSPRPALRAPRITISSTASAEPRCGGDPRGRAQRAPAVVVVAAENHPAAADHRRAPPAKQALMPGRHGVALSRGSARPAARRAPANASPPRRSGPLSSMHRPRRGLLHPRRGTAPRGRPRRRGRAPEPVPRSRHRVSSLARREAPPRAPPPRAGGSGAAAPSAARSAPAPGGAAAGSDRPAVEEAEELAVRRQHEARGAVAQRLAIGLQRAVEVEELGVLAERLGEDADRLGVALAAQDLRLRARASAISTRRSRSARARIRWPTSAPCARSSLASRSRSVCIRRKIAWLFSGGRSARLMRTSTSSTPNPPRDRLASLWIRFIELRAVLREDREQRRLAQHAAQAREDDRLEPAAEGELVADRLPKAQRIDDPVAGEGVDHEPLLVAQHQLDRRRIEVEHALLEVVDLLDERHLQVQPGLVDDADRVAELQHQRLLGLVDGEQAAEQQEQRHHDQRRRRPS